MESDNFDEISRARLIAETLDWCKSVCDVASSDPSVAPQASEAICRLMRCFGEAADECRGKYGLNQDTERGGE